MEDCQTIEKSDFYSTSHNATATAILLEILEMLPGTHLGMKYKVFPLNLGMFNSNH